VTQKDRIALGVGLDQLDRAIGYLEKAPERAAEIAKASASPGSASEFVIKESALRTAVEGSSKELRGLLNYLRESFPKVSR
jgi:hypothetical protein